MEGQGAIIKISHSLTGNLRVPTTVLLRLSKVSGSFGGNKGFLLLIRDAGWQVCISLINFKNGTMTKLLPNKCHCLVDENLLKYGVFREKSHK